jgi:hypothetical protein
VNVTSAAADVVGVAYVATGAARNVVPAVIGVDASDCVEMDPLGVTLTVYTVPFERPVTTHDCAPVGGVDVLATVHDGVCRTLAVYTFTV